MVRKMNREDGKGRKNNTYALIKDVRRDWQLYLFLVLPIIYIIIFAYLPIGGLVIAFKDYSMRKGIWGSDWVGLEHFIRFFESYQFGRILKNTLALSVYNILASFPIPICFALLLNCIENQKFKKFTQSVATLPYFISVTVMVGILYQVLGSRVGLYGTLMESLTGAYPKDLFGIPEGFRHIYVWSGVWQNFGWNSIIYTAALASVDPSYHEAAKIDGATRLQRILYIDLPSILPTIVVMLILRMGSVLSIGFEKVYLLQNSLNISASDIVSTYVYEIGLASSGGSNFSYATAIGFFNSIINLILVVSVNKIANKISGESLW